MEDWTNEELHQMLAKVTQRATIDCEFRALALKDGTAAISRMTSKPLPKNITYKFVDNAGPTKVIPLPDFVANRSDELSEDELEHVAGGDGPPISGGWSKIAPLQKLAKQSQ